MIADLDVATDGLLQFARRAVDSPANLFFGERRKPALHQIQPGGFGGHEVHRKEFRSRLGDDSEVKLDHALHSMSRQQA